MIGFLLAAYNDWYNMVRIEMKIMTATITSINAGLIPVLTVKKLRTPFIRMTDMGMAMTQAMITNLMY